MYYFIQLKVILILLYNYTYKKKRKCSFLKYNKENNFYYIFSYILILQIFKYKKEIITVNKTLSFCTQIMQLDY